MRMFLIDTNKIPIHTENHSYYRAIHPMPYLVTNVGIAALALWLMMAFSL